jgi:hypothetical protein
MLPLATTRRIQWQLTVTQSQINQLEAFTLCMWQPTSVAEVIGSITSSLSCTIARQFPGRIGGSAAFPASP